MTRKIRAKDGEKLTKDNIKLVIELLGQDKPITKKFACETLNITYNTTRLNRIIEDYIAELEYVKTMRAKLRSQPISNAEAKEIVEGYLSGDALSYLCETTFRSVDKIKSVLTKYNIPFRSEEQDYFNSAMVADKALSQTYEEGDLVYAARYNSPAYIRALFSKADDGPVYSLTIIGDHRRNAYQPWYELADLRPLQKELGVEISDFSAIEINTMLAEARKRANARKSK